MKGYIFKKISVYDFYNKRANKLGFVSQWRIETESGALVGIADTKKEAISLVRRHKQRTKAV